MMMYENKLISKYTRHNDLRGSAEAYVHGRGGEDFTMSNGECVQGVGSAPCSPITLYLYNI